MFTAGQILAIVMLLQAFGVGQTTIDQVKLDLNAAAATSTPAITTPDPTPVFGSVPTTPVVNVPPPPQWSLKIKVDNANPVAGKDMSRISVNVYDADGKLRKEPISVGTNDPDFPNSFTINAPGQVNFFCVAPVYDGFPNNGCKNEYPVSVGTYDFTFSSHDATATTTVVVRQNETN